MMKTKSIILGVLAVIVITFIYYWPTVHYGIDMGMGQLKIISNSKPIATILNDSTFPDSLKKKLKLIQAVRQYAVDSLGLKDTDNYTSVYDQKGKEVMWVVQACQPYKFEIKQWKFPFVGTVPYKGFFNWDDAREEKEKLEKENWDTGIFNPSGWSTLGWFNDPILSSMLSHSDGDLASLIIHEMVHSTIYVKDNAELNENLASFIGDKGAESFLLQAFGDSAQSYKSYIKIEEIRRKKVQHMLRATKKLDSLYHTFLKSYPVSQKRKMKNDFIRKIFETLDTINPYFSKINPMLVDKELPNNTYFINYLTYESMYQTLNFEWTNTYGESLKALILGYKSKYMIG